MSTQIKFFQPGDDTTADWHAYREESPTALCGEATLSYNRDRVSDFVPTDGGLHDGCRQAIDAENPTPYQPAEGPTDTATADAPDDQTGGDQTGGDQTTADDQTAAADADSQSAADATADAGQSSDDGVGANDAQAVDSGDQTTDQP